MKAATWKFLSKIGDFVYDPTSLGLLTLLFIGFGFAAGYFFGLGARADTRLAECKEQMKEVTEGAAVAWSDGVEDGERICESEAMTCGQIKRQWFKGYYAGTQDAQERSQECETCTEARDDARKELEDCQDVMSAYNQARIIVDDRLDHCAEQLCKEQNRGCVPWEKCLEVRRECEHRVRNWDAPDGGGEER
jgi:hypothetical protein